MARRPDPRRPDFLAELDAAPAYGSPHPDLEMELKSHILDALPPGVPTCLRRIIHVARCGEEICALVQVFDGLICSVGVRGSRDTVRQYRWAGVQTPFGWDVKQGRWRRYPERRRDTS